MQIEKLKWDSDFFGYAVGSINVVSENYIDLKSIRDDKNKLLYIFSDKPISADYLKDMNAQKVDEKLELVRTIDINEPLPELSNQLKDIDFVDAHITNLALQSGIYSRYLTDKNFKNNEFEKLYSAWIENSVNKKIAAKVIGYAEDGKIAGLITIGIKNNMADIGLLGVDKNFRRKNIGHELLMYCLHFGKNNKISQVSVVTQGQNITAVNFYKKNGFVIRKNTFIYHLWK